MTRGITPKDCQRLSKDNSKYNTISNALLRILMEDQTHCVTTNSRLRTTSMKRDMIEALSYAELH